MAAALRFQARLGQTDKHGIANCEHADRESWDIDRRVVGISRPTALFQQLSPVGHLMSRCTEPDTSDLKVFTTGASPLHSLF